jgi:exopolyphosphatase/guanosine-5'-triphosphate,3'-diphosphate pyrophosphatase
VKNITRAWSGKAFFSVCLRQGRHAIKNFRMRRAVIDIGSNTVKLLVADVHDAAVTPLVSKDQTTRLGEGVGEFNRLSARAIARTIRSVHAFVEEARQLGARDVQALTTSAARDAVNRDEFLDAIRSQCGLEVQVITGEREAELIFLGVSSDSEWSNQPISVLDVGGGSAEFIQGQAGRIEVFHSLPLGALRLTEQFGEGRFAELCDYIRATLRPALARHNLQGRRLIGTGGTITTLAHVNVVGRVPSRGVAPSPAVCSGPTRADTVDHRLLTLDHLRSLVDDLRALPLAERRKVPGLPPERADIIVAGGAVFLTAMEVLGATELTVSVRNLRYGALVAS